MRLTEEFKLAAMKARDVTCKQHYVALLACPVLQGEEPTERHREQMQRIVQELKTCLSVLPPCSDPVPRRVEQYRVLLDAIHEFVALCGPSPDVDFIVGLFIRNPRFDNLLTSMPLERAA